MGTISISFKLPAKMNIVHIIIMIKYNIKYLIYHYKLERRKQREPTLVMLIEEFFG
jgi:hypothetical protein